jgi:glycerol uptake facilitator-like aquaporin
MTAHYTLLPAELASQPFAGRLGGNQEFILDPKNLENKPALRRVPDASPFISFQELFNLRALLEPGLWKAALSEGLGTALWIWITAFISAHSSSAPRPIPSPTSGIYSTPIFLGPLVGGISDVVLLPLFIYCLGPISGAHLNPLITMSTFAARLTSLPRMLLYIAFQTAGGAVAGLLLRISYGSREFLVGGCAIDTELIPIWDIFVIELMADFTLLFLAFGVGLDPRQKNMFSPAIGPILVGVVLGVLVFGTGVARTGYDGASMNPARCTGVFVGSSFPTFTWIIWVAPIAASIIHGSIYWVLPPWISPKPDTEKEELG